MSDMVMTALITTTVPALTTVITTAIQMRTNRRNAAKQSILQMIMEDQFNWHDSKKLPINYQNVLREYEIYHKAGGNGVITRKVQEYEAWIDHIEDLANKLVKN